MSALKKILVVDDDPVIGKSFDRVLASKGYAVITATSGEEAMTKLSSEKYDAVFTDIKMPGMSGLLVAEQLKASQPWLPVVIITGYGSPDNKIRAENAGVVEFLHKPLSPEMIEESTANALSFSEDAAEYIEEAANQASIPKRNVFKDLALFLLAPFIGLAYLLAFPAIGFGLMAYALYKSSPKFRAVANIVFAPFVTVAFVTLGPIVGLGLAAYFGTKAWFKMLN